MTIGNSLRRDTLAEQIAENLARYVAEHQLAPGQMLPSETRLAAEFGVSRPVVREALKALAAQGLIAVANGKGAAVKALASDPLISYFQHAVRIRREAFVELIELRRGIEIQSAGLAASRRTAEQAAGLERTVREMRTAIGDEEHWIALDARLHLAIARATQNEMIYHVTESIREPMKALMHEGFRRRRDDPQREQNQQVHETLVAAIVARDLAAATAAMEAHFGVVMTLLQAETPENHSG